MEALYMYINFINYFWICFENNNKHIKKEINW